jgi:tetratricopeptide (TPR) repeat protein
MQDEIVARLANQLGTELISAEARRGQKAATPDSMDLYFRGMEWMNRGTNRENMDRARGFFERALALDPGNVDALLGVGRVDYFVGAAFLSDDRAASLAAAQATIVKVLSLRPNDALAHEIMGGILIQTGRADRGIAELQRALALDPNLAAAHGDIGFAKLFTGRDEEIEAHENEALRLSPHDSSVWLWLHAAGAGKMNLGADEEALALFRRSIENNRTFPVSHFFLAAMEASRGGQEEAQSEVKAGLALDPGFTIRRFRFGAEAQGDNPIYRARLERLIERMRKAGVPEG